MKNLFHTTIALGLVIALFSITASPALAQEKNSTVRRIEAAKSQRAPERIVRPTPQRNSLEVRSSNFGRPAVVPPGRNMEKSGLRVGIDFRYDPYPQGEWRWVEETVVEYYEKYVQHSITKSREYRRDIQVYVTTTVEIPAHYERFENPITYGWWEWVEYTWPTTVYRQGTDPRTSSQGRIGTSSQGRLGSPPPHTSGSRTVQPQRSENIVTPPSKRPPMPSSVPKTASKGVRIKPPSMDISKMKKSSAKPTVKSPTTLGNKPTLKSSATTEKKTK